MGSWNEISLSEIWTRRHGSMQGNRAAQPTWRERPNWKGNECICVILVYHESFKYGFPFLELLSPHIASNRYGSKTGRLQNFHRVGRRSDRRVMNTQWYTVATYVRKWDEMYFWDEIFSIYDCFGWYVVTRCQRRTACQQERGWGMGASEGQRKCVEQPQPIVKMMEYGM